MVWFEGVCEDVWVFSFFFRCFCWEVVFGLVCVLGWDVGLVVLFWLGWWCGGWCSSVFWYVWSLLFCWCLGVGIVCVISWRDLGSFWCVVGCIWSVCGILYWSVLGWWIGGYWFWLGICWLGSGVCWVSFLGSLVFWIIGWRFFCRCFGEWWS